MQPTYDETLDFLFNRLQSFHNDGATAYKPGLDKAFALSKAFGNPHRQLRVVHVGGTNGKGSTAHTLASILMDAGLKVGLYTSPHLVDFTERIRIDGQPIGHDEVIDFVERFRAAGLERLDPSFFELTTIMAFEHFARNQVDVAVVEVGLGGRLDTTNIVNPILSVITNISFDHTALLGNTLVAIAGEKAGIIKHGVPVVIGRRNRETDPVFIDAAERNGSTLIFASDARMYESYESTVKQITYLGTPYGDIHSPLTGACQPENMTTILAAVTVLADVIPALTPEAVRAGVADVIKNTRLMGRWMHISDSPEVIADTGHNVDGWRYISEQLNFYLPRPLFVVLGFVSDKDYGHIMEMLPREAAYFFVRPSVARAANVDDVAAAARRAGLDGQTYQTVAEGYHAALEAAKAQTEPGATPLIYVGGSTFVVADLLSIIN